VTGESTFLLQFQPFSSIISHVIRVDSEYEVGIGVTEAIPWVSSSAWRFVTRARKWTVASRASDDQQIWPFIQAGEKGLCPISSFQQISLSWLLDATVTVTGA
jgi:hypothetical protein